MHGGQLACLDRRLAYGGAGITTWAFLTPKPVFCSSIHYVSMSALTTPPGERLLLLFVYSLLYRQNLDWNLHVVWDQ